jgi:peptide subunit release factor 1 (eRF1)
VERRHEWHVRQHLERVLAVLRDRDSSNLDRVLVGGDKQTVHELLELMPRRVRARTRLIAGLRVEAATSEVLERVLETQAQAEREAEEELLDSLLERDRAHAAIGQGPVIEAVSDSRVHTLVYSADLEMHGSECETCGWLSLGQTPEACPRCHGAVHAVGDLLELAARRVAAAGGRIEEVRGPAALTLNRREGIAALLRYEPSVNGHGPAAA